MTPFPRPRVLFVSETAPWPPSTGARQRSAVVVRALREVADVRMLLIMGDPPSGPDVDEMSRQFGPVDFLRPAPPADAMPWRLGRWIAPRLADRAAAALDPRHPALVDDPQLAADVRRYLHSHPVDVIVCRYVTAALRARLDEHRPVIMDLDDVEPLMLRSALEDPALAWWRKSVVRARLKCLNRDYARRLSGFASLLVSSETDAAAIPGRVAGVLPNIPYESDGDPIPALAPARGSKEVLIVASWYYPPNFHGLDRFLNHCWPTVRQEVPDAVLNVVGGSMRPVDRERWARTPGVRVTGFCPHLRAEYARAALAIAPVYYGGGTKIKVLEALAHQRACVAAPHAHRGYERLLPAGEALLVPADDAAFAADVVALLRNEDRRDRMAARGRELVGEHFSMRRVREVIAREIGAALGTGRSEPHRPERENTVRP